MDGVPRGPERAGFQSWRHPRGGARLIPELVLWWSESLVPPGEGPGVREVWPDLPPTPTLPFLSRASVYLSPISLRCTDDISASGERAVRVGEPLGLHMPALLPLRGWPAGCHAAISAPNLPVTVGRDLPSLCLLPSVPGPSQLEGRQGLVIKSGWKRLKGDRN